MSVDRDDIDNLLTRALSDQRTPLEDSGFTLQVLQRLPKPHPWREALRGTVPTIGALLCLLPVAIGPLSRLVRHLLRIDVTPALLTSTTPLFLAVMFSVGALFYCAYSETFDSQ